VFATAKGSGVVAPVPKAGGEPVAIAATGCPRGIVLDGDRVYWTDYGTIYAAPKTGGTGWIAAKCHAGSFVDLAVLHRGRDGRIFAMCNTMYEAEQLVTLSRGGGCVARGFARRTQTADAIASDASHVYWATMNGIFRAPWP
jgi:hypothetical protein